MKIITWIVLIAVVVLGYLLINKYQTNETVTTRDVQKLEERSAQEPTAEESINALIGIPENEAEARYEAEMKATKQ